jgi:hypothetical protein
MSKVRLFDITDHYWLVASTGGLWSSKVGGYVTQNDADYLAWKGDEPGDDMTSKIASEDELIEALTGRGVSLGALVPPARVELPKSTVMARVFALGKSAQVKTLFDANFELQSQWYSPDWPNVFVDDAGLLAALTAIGLTDEEKATILAVG